MEYTDHSEIDLIEYAESEKEEVEETDVDEYFKFSYLSSKNINQDNLKFKSSDILLFKLFIDVFTPPPKLRSLLA